jgi:hypothetical protein
MAPILIVSPCAAAPRLEFKEADQLKGTFSKSMSRGILSGKRGRSHLSKATTTITRRYLLKINE